MLTHPDEKMIVMVGNARVTGIVSIAELEGHGSLYVLWGVVM